MSCIIGGVTLDHTPIWRDRNRYFDVSTESSTAIDGSEINVNGVRGSHYPITLECTSKTGWQLGSTVTSLRALSAVANAYYTLVLNGTSYTVRFRNEQGGGAIQMETLLTHSNPGVSDWYIGTIYLMCTG
jgi:hypothetical protein